MVVFVAMPSVYDDFISNMKPILLISYLLVLFSLCKTLTAILSFDFRVKYDLDLLVWFTQTSEICRSLQNPKSKTMWPLTRFQHQVPAHQNQPETGAWRESLAARVGSVPERLNPASSPLLLQTWNVPSRTQSSCFARFLWRQPHQVRTLRIFLFL